MNAERQKRLDEIAKEKQTLHEQIQGLNNACYTLNDEKEEILIADYIETYGLKVGDKVQFKDGKEIKTGVIKSIQCRYGDVCPIVALHKKDGSIGARIKYHWYHNAPTKID